MSGPVPAAVVFTGMCQCALVTADPRIFPEPVTEAVVRHAHALGETPEAVAAELTWVATHYRGWRTP